MDDGFMAGFVTFLILVGLGTVAFNFGGCEMREQVKKGQAIYLGDQEYRCQKVESK